MPIHKKIAKVAKGVGKGLVFGAKHFTPLGLASQFGEKVGNKLGIFGGGGDDKNNKLKQIADSDFGFTPEQMQVLSEMLGQQLGATKTLATNRLKQSTAGAPASVRQSVLANLENQFLGAKQRGITQIQSSGLNRQLRALMALLQADIQREQISANKDAQQLAQFAEMAAIFGKLQAGGVSG